MKKKTNKHERANQNRLTGKKPPKSKYAAKLKEGDGMYSNMKRGK